MVSYLFTNYIEGEGITLGMISTTDRLYEKYNASFYSLESCLQELSDAIGASCYISPDKKFYFVTKDSIQVIQMPEHITGLKMEDSGVDVKTVQTVTGAVEETTTQSATFAWIANQMTAVVSYQVSSLLSATINSVPAGIGILGVDDADISVTFLWRYGSNTITVNSNATTKPTTGQTVVFVYKGYYDIIVTSVNDQLRSELSTLNGTSGNIESLYTDETLNNFTDATDTANDLLIQKGERVHTVSATSQDLADTEPLLAWDIDRADLGIVGQFVIVERTIEDFIDDKHLIRVKMKNKGLFSRYGTSLVEKQKQIRPETLVYLSTAYQDIAVFLDSYEHADSGIAIYPSSTELYDPLGFPMYPQDYVKPISVFEVGGIGPNGGIVFYVTGGGLHGLEASKVAEFLEYMAYDDRSVWISGGSTQTTLNGNTLTGIGEGSDNTDAIIAQSGHVTSAALLCKDYNQFGVTDYYLPSRDELELMQDNMTILGMSSANDYWCSSESNATSAIYIQFNIAAFPTGSKNGMRHIRAIRSF